MKNPFFSVIIPSYNHGNFIEKSINSVLKQTFKNYEIIIIDNYSTDSTNDILNKYKNKIVFKKIHNLGIIAKSRNLGIKISKGKWICFLDSDDEWFSDKLKIVYEQISINPAQVICNNEIIIKGSSKYFYRYGPFKDLFYKYLIINGNCISTSGSCVDKNFILTKKINFIEKKEFITVEDYDFFLNLANFNAKFIFLNKFLGKRNVHNYSNSSNYKFHRNSLLNLLKHHIYNIQNFEKKSKLLAIINFRIKFMDLINYFKKKKYFLFFKLLIFLIRSSILQFIALLTKQIIKSIKSRIYY
jgi:glycosyltransferase involved in cell wall biosynthesis